MKTAKLYLSPLRRAKSRRDGTLLTVCFSLRAISLRAVLLPALAFFTCANLHAQVTIGGTEIPKSGAILDLNSTAKGGLVLSNVPLGNLSEIPSSFPGAGAANSADLKKGLTGSVIYNTNPTFCTGVHLWNGQHWGRITAETPVYTPGTLSITSSTDDLFGGTEVEFTAASGAKIYRWYASINGDPYEYLGITTGPVFSEIFPAGNCRVKVIMDDCRSLKESNKVTFVPGVLSPNFGSLTGGNYIYIYGDFPYAATGDYVQDGLVAHFDGINNRGLGDKRHDYSSTANWKDLKNPSFDLPRGGGDGQWLSNGFQALGDDDDNVYSFYSTATYPIDYPLGNKARTVEVIFRTPDKYHMFVQELDVQRRIFRYGISGVPRQHFGVLYRGQTRDACSPTNKWVFYAISGNLNNLITCLSSTPSLEEPDSINTVTSTYQDSMTDPLTKSYINNIPATIVEQTGYLDTQQGHLLIGGNLSHSTFLSVRLYNRVLSETEIEHNAELDQKRYLTPPNVTIGGNPCTEVVVLSDHFLMCKVPAGTSGQKDVEVDGITYAGAYKYVSAGDFYVSKISPIIGTAGTTLTLEGNRLNEISEVSAGGVPCTNVTYQDAVKYECVLPSNSSGEVDITIKLNDETVYRFAKVFEYQ
jgi:hypothetical protein